jgi:four helix bundle protein
LVEEKKEYVLSKQLVRSGTSIGANIEEAIGGHSKADILYKLSIAYKETRETLYWIKLLQATGILSIELSKNLYSEAEEICKIIGKIQISMKNS